jgi:hypothetical protein
MSFAFDAALPNECYESAWAIYNRAFDELRRTAVQRHVMFREEFDALMADTRVGKYRGLLPEGGPVVTALATFTNELDALPLISPEYFAHRWPSLYAEKRIWYIGLFAVDPAHQSTGVFEEIIRHMWATVLATGGVGMLDMSRSNFKRGLSSAIHSVLQALTPEATATCVDEQQFWCYAPPGAV